MNPETVDWAQIVNSLGAIRQELARLGERVALLETAAGLAPAAAAPAAPPLDRSKPEPEGLSEEHLLVISAAIAAYLGKRAHIRQVRLLGSAAWAQQGRVTIQASHSLAIYHG
jgi:methylmalonyl-CoA carboxyltransferase large subunit